MKKQELAQRLADEQKVTTGAAADHLDDIIFSVLKKLKLGKSAAFPGFGQIKGLGRIKPSELPRIKPAERQSAPQIASPRESK